MEKNTSFLPPLLIGVGFLLIAIGLIYWFFQDKLTWIGNLPGDFRYEKDNFSFYAPIATMILLSILGSILLRFGRFLLDFLK